MPQRGRTLKYLIKNNIKAAREQRGLSRYALDKELGRAHPYIKDVENGWRLPTIEVLADLCRVLNKKPEELITIDFSDIYNKLETT